MVFEGMTIWYALAIFLAGTVMLLVSHMLIMRYRRIVVPSALFWRQSVGNHRFIKPFYRLSYIKTLLFLIFMAGLFCLLMLRPALVSDRLFVIIVDCRAGMAVAGDSNGRTRLDIARDIALDMIDDIEKSASLAVIAVTDTAEMLAKPGDSELVAYDSVSTLKVCDSNSQLAMADAFALADIVAKSFDKSHIQIFAGSPISEISERYSTSTDISIYYPGLDYPEGFIPPASTFVPLKVYISDNVPLALKRFYLASEHWQIISEIDHAELLVLAEDEFVGNADGLPNVVVSSSGIAQTGVFRVRLSEYFEQYFPKGTDLTEQLYAGAGYAIDYSDQQAIALLVSEDGSVLAGLSGSKLTLSDSLFALDSNIWKEPSFLELFSVLSQLPVSGRGISSTETDVLYYNRDMVGNLESELWDYSAFVGFGVDFTIMLFSLILAGVLFDIYFYSRGRII